MLVNFPDDLPGLRDYIARRVQTQAKQRQPVSAIEIGFQLNQAGLLLIYFDTNDEHEQDGSWTLDLGGPTLKLPHWQAAYESAGEQATSFVMPDGQPRNIAAGAGDAVVAGVFGEALLAIASDALARGAFAPLPLRDNCQLDVEEFDGMYSWPVDYDDHGRTNLLSQLAAVRLPR